MKKKSMILISLSFIILLSLLSRIALTEVVNYDDEFKKAARFRGREAELGTDYLIKDTAEVLHKENMKTHAELEKLKKEIEELKKQIKEIKDIVEGG
ncbi:MAG: hypothetical protein AMJ78_07395 [Omnitrophica WOR_2 bacterium SM23_29]|nr:MAG: hypothetical protein AMJ78_07395 [Omnitrophica WOR_2 bacterium SM23_29]